MSTTDAKLASERLTHAGLIEDATWMALTHAMAQAAAVTLAVAAAGFAVRTKADRSPVTEADERSQAILIAAVERLLPGIAVISEEATERPARLGRVFVLIDPLDGTKEFVTGSPEFTINLGIIRDGRPLAGLTAVPAQGLVYRGIVGAGADRINVNPDGTVASTQPQPLKVRRAMPPLTAAISRSHLDSATTALLNRLGVTARVACGSALKFCRVCEGAADIYPRLATTCEWDVAAGHALVVAAGGSVTLPDGEELLYGALDRDLRVPAFIAWGDRTGILDAERSRESS